MADDTPQQHRGFARMFGQSTEPDDELQLRPDHDLDTFEAPNLGEPDVFAEPAITEENDPKGRPPLVQVGGDIPNSDYPDQASLMREQRETQSEEGEVQAIPPSEQVAPGPQREHVEYHVVLTERRGNKRSARRTVYVPANNGAQGPTQILPLDPTRRRAVISIIAASNDGWFAAFSDASMQPFEWDFPGGAFEVPPAQASNAFLQPCKFDIISSPVTWVYESEEELYALFVPDNNLTPAGQACIISIASEFGDAQLGKQEVARGGGDR